MKWDSWENTRKINRREASKAPKSVIGADESLSCSRAVITADERLEGSRSVIGADESLGCSKSKITASESLGRRKNMIFADEKLGVGNSVIASDESLKYKSEKRGKTLIQATDIPTLKRNTVNPAKNRMFKYRGYMQSKRRGKKPGTRLKNLAGRVGNLTQRGAERAEGKLKWTGIAVFNYVKDQANPYNEVSNDDNVFSGDETRFFYDVAGKAGSAAWSSARAAGSIGVRGAFRGTKLAGQAGYSIGNGTKRFLWGKNWWRKVGWKKRSKINRATNPVNIAKNIVNAVKNLVKVISFVITNFQTVFIIGAVLLAIFTCWQILSAAIIPMAPVSWIGDSGDVEEQPLADYLAEKVPVMKDEYIVELQKREKELRAEGYNHFMIWNMAGTSLGDTVKPTNIRNPDCGLINDEEYIKILGPVFNACLLAKYGEGYTKANADEIAEELFDLITYRVEQPLNDKNGDGIGDYLYCDGTLRLDNNYSCYAFYKDSKGKKHAWPGCGGVCWNCDATWKYHSSPDPAHNSCDKVTGHTCPGHLQTDGTKKYCNPGCKDVTTCYGYKKCHGHKEIAIIIGNGDATELLQKYFLDPIAELEAKGTLTPDEQTKLSNLKTWYEIAKNSLDNPVEGITIQ